MASALVSYSSGSESDNEDDKDSAPIDTKTSETFAKPGYERSDSDKEDDSDAGDANAEARPNLAKASANPGGNSFGLIQSSDQEDSDNPASDDNSDEASDGFVEVEFEDATSKAQISSSKSKADDRKSNALPSFAAASAGHESVFVTEYHKAEQRKLAVLAHHVTPTTSSAAATEAGRQAGLRKIPLCRRFLSGRCDRGARCPYSHSEEAKERAMVVRPNAPTSSSVGESRSRKRGHAGVTDTLAPAKKSLTVLGPQLGLRGHK